ncbi:DUF502 domain-containing protein [Methylogaea oryzae]|uniref:Membrane protein n=1 Tax=Methylogaea oryzae TaxID=1295382 RepID=A0A8D5AMB2_9GAMM|nr:DUF502 domain-containing protein [Methylogaea oryzae]BBL70935.1 membrane protein [Methylogaea oryzae]
MRNPLQILKTSLNYFLLGLLAVIPLVVVMQISIWLAQFLLNTVFDVRSWVGQYWITAVVFFGVYALLVYIGYELTKHRQSLIVSLIDLVIERLPFLRTVYRVSKKVIDMFRGRGEEKVREVVYVEYPKDGVWVPAYVTNKEGECYVLFIPTSPNPTSGFTVIVHESKVVKSQLSFEEVSTFIISVGADYPKAAEACRLPH